MKRCEHGSFLERCEICELESKLARVTCAELLELVQVLCHSVMNAALRERTEACAKKLDSMHDKITNGWDFYTDERADGAHNALTNGAAAIRALLKEN